MKTIYTIAAVLCAYLSVTDASDKPTTATLDGIAATRADMHTAAAKQRAGSGEIPWQIEDAFAEYQIARKGNV